MLSDIEKIMVKEREKIYSTLKINLTAYRFVFVATFLCRKVTHVLFAG